MRITSKGQVTIPQHIRDQAGLLPHTEIEFHYEDGKVWITKAPESENWGWRLVEKLRGRAKGGLTTDEIMAMTRGED